MSLGAQKPLALFSFDVALSGENRPLPVLIKSELLSLPAWPHLSGPCRVLGQWAAGSSISSPGSLLPLQLLEHPL